MKQSKLRLSPRARTTFIIIGITLAVFVGIGALFLSNNAAPKPARGRDPGAGIPVEVARARTGTVMVEADVVGTLLANESVMIRPEIAGRVAAIHFREGRLVKKGAKLITLDTSELHAQLAQSEAAAKLARLSYERMEGLVAKRLVSQQAYDEASARLTEAEAKVKLDKARLGKAVLRAPFTGVLGVRRVSPGDYVAAGQDIVNLESIQPVKVDLRLPAVYARGVSVAQPIRLRVDAFPGETYEGEIYVVDPRLDTATRTILVRARVPNPERKLRPGMFASATVVLAKRESAVLVPEQALVPSGDDQFVFRVVGGKVAMTKVTVGQRRGGEAEIVAGLAADDVVVTAGHQKIRDGVPVTILNASARSLAPAGAKAASSPTTH